jgi:hypothetical protein
MPAILATWEAEIGRIMFRGQPGQIVCAIPISKITRAVPGEKRNPEFLGQ